MATDGAELIGSMVGSIRTGVCVGAGALGAGGVGLSSRSSLVDRPGGTNCWSASLPLTANNVASEPRIYLLMSDRIRKNCLSAGAIPLIGCSTNTTEYKLTPTMIITVQQNVTAIQNLITASCCSCVIARNWLISFSGFIGFLFQHFRFEQLIRAGSCYSTLWALASRFVPVFGVLTKVPNPLTPTKPNDCQYQA